MQLKIEYKENEMSKRLVPSAIAAPAAPTHFCVSIPNNCVQMFSEHCTVHINTMSSSNEYRYRCIVYKMRHFVNDIC